MKYHISSEEIISKRHESEIDSYYLSVQMRARSTDYDKLTASQRFCHDDLITDFVTVVSSQSEGLGKMALGIVKYAYDRSSQLIGVIWFGMYVKFCYFRCKDSVDFSLTCAWLLTGYASSGKHSKRLTRAQKLRNLILSGDLGNSEEKLRERAPYALSLKSSSPNLCKVSSNGEETFNLRHKRKSHKRSKSDMSGMHDFFLS